MAKKTPAELQIEMLKQLRKGGNTPPPKKKTVSSKDAKTPKVKKISAVKSPPRGKGDFELSVVSKAVDKSTGKELLPRIKVNSRRLSALKKRLKTAKEVKTSTEAWEWALELLQGTPLAAAGLSPQAKEDLFKEIKDWLRQRGLDHD